jgi:hypothetical protein
MVNIRLMRCKRNLVCGDDRGPNYIKIIYYIDG